MNSPESHARRKWREWVRRQRSSGMSVAAFCARHRIAACSLYAWRRRLAAEPVFVEAKVAGVMGPRSPVVIEVRLRGGRRVLVSRASFDRELLVEVVAALEGLPRGTEGSS